MIQRVKALAAKANDLSWITRSHMVMGEKQFLHISLWPPFVCCGTHTHVHARRCTHADAHTHMHTHAHTETY